MNQPPGRSATDLAGVESNGADERLRSCLHVHIVKNNGSTFSTKFKFCGYEIATA